MIDKRIPAGDSSSHTILHEQNTITQNHPVVVAVHNIYRGESIACCGMKSENQQAQLQKVNEQCVFVAYDCCVFAFMNVFFIWG